MYTENDYIILAEEINQLEAGYHKLRGDAKVYRKYWIHYLLNLLTYIRLTIDGNPRASVYKNICNTNEIFVKYGFAIIRQPLTTS
jgi:hypothetical protein